MLLQHNGCVLVLIHIITLDNLVGSSIKALFYLLLKRLMQTDVL